MMLLEKKNGYLKNSRPPFVTFSNLINYICSLLVYFIQICFFYDTRSPSLRRSLQLPHIPVTAFPQIDLCFSLNLSQIQMIPTETSITNCNNKHGLMPTCRNDVDMFTWGRIVSSSPKRAHVDWNWPISQEKYLVCKNAIAFAYYGSCRQAP